MTTDTNLSQIVFNRLSNEKYHELKTSGQLNDQQFYITPDLDTNPGLIQDYMSNCITKIPQHINLELSTNGTLTLKAGSKVYVPNGKNADDSLKFDEVVIGSDISRTFTLSNVTILISYIPNKGTLAAQRLDLCTSGTTVPTGTGLFYNTADNIIRGYTSGTMDVNNKWSFPIVIVTADASGKLSINQVFNGIGYIGAVAFAVPGVQAIIPNGFNNNSQLNNYTATVERVLLKDYAAGNVLGQNLPLTLTNSPLLSVGDMIYVEEENQMYKTSISELNKRTEVEIAKVTTDSTRITSLTPLPVYNRILSSAQVYETIEESLNAGHIGQIGYTTRTDVPEGCSWCDGAEYTKAQFPDIYQMLIDGKLQSTTVIDFDSKVSTNGSCGFFGLDTSNERFKVPLLKDVYLKAGQEPVIFGGESLPNIKGQLWTGDVTDIGTYVNGLNTDDEGGMFYKGELVQGYNEAGGSNNYVPKYDFSRACSTYQDGAKVNPDHVVYRAYVVLYSSAAGASEVQAAEFINALTNKANVGLDNVSPAQSFKDMSIGWGMPDYTATISLNVSQLTSGYTAPTDGCIIGCWNPKNTTGSQKITLNGITIWGGYSYVTGVFIYMKKDDVVVFGQTDEQLTDIKFAPLKGVN